MFLSIDRLAFIRPAPERLVLGLVFLIAIVLGTLLIFEKLKKDPEPTDTNDTGDTTQPIKVDPVDPVDPGQGNTVETDGKEDGGGGLDNDGEVLWVAHGVNIGLFVLTCILNGLWYILYGKQQTRNKKAGLPTPFWETSTFYLLLGSLFLIGTSILSDYYLRGSGSFLIVLVWYTLAFFLMLGTFLFTLRSFGSTYRSRKRIFDEGTILFSENATPENAKLIRETIEDLNDMKNRFNEFLEDNPFTRTAGAVMNPTETATNLVNAAIGTVSGASVAAKNGLIQSVTAGIQATPPGGNLAPVSTFEDPNAIPVFDPSKIKTVEERLDEHYKSLGKGYFETERAFNKRFLKSAKELLRLEFDTFKSEIQIQGIGKTDDLKIDSKVEEYATKKQIGEE